MTRNDAPVRVSPPPGGRTVLLFDGVCEVCNTGVAWIRARDRDGRFEFLPYQSEEAAGRYPALDPQDLARAMHVVAPDGTVFAGVDAAPAVFGALPGWEWVARALALPGMRAFARPAYAWLARRRRLFGGAATATCATGSTRPSRER